MLFFVSNSFYLSFPLNFSTKDLFVVDVVVVVVAVVAVAVVDVAALNR